jgi:hypothetical protein
VDIKDSSMVIRGDRATISELRVNTAAKPKQIDTKNLDGPEKGSIQWVFTS